MLLVVGDLLGSSSGGLIDGEAHAFRHLVGIEDHASVDITSSTPCRLSQGAVRSEEPFLVSVEYSDKGYLG